MSPMDKITSLKDMVGNKPVFSRERVVEMERVLRCLIPSKVSLGQRWHVVQHKKFSRTRKRRMQRQRAANKIQFIDVPYKKLFEEVMELEKVNEGMVPSL